jgi:tetratricopeptide (TPR) repeat protein
MRIYPCKNNIINLTVILLIFLSASILFAEEQNLRSADNHGYINDRLTPHGQNNLTALQKEARQYRAQGLESQRIGNIDTAMSFYQKAIGIDPSYTIAYNDLGIIYEGKGFIDQAEDCYLKAIKIDPNYLSAYTNLALVYENKRDLKNAAFYWGKRAELGSLDDPWTQKALQRLKDIRLVLSEGPQDDARELEIIGLLKDIEGQKPGFKKDNKELASDYFQKAKRTYKKGDKVTALKLAVDAIQLDPSNAEIQKFIDKIQTRLLSE